MKYLIWVIICLASLLTNCQSSPEEANLPSGQLPPPSATSIPVEGGKLEPGPYCFDYRDKNSSMVAQLLLEPNNSMTGTIEGTIHNDEEAYYTSYTQFVTGILQDNQWDVAITTKIEDDTQEKRATWILTAEYLNTGREKYTNIDCETLIQ